MSPTAPHSFVGHRTHPPNWAFLSQFSAGDVVGARADGWDFLTHFTASQIAATRTRGWSAISPWIGLFSSVSDHAWREFADEVVVWNGLLGALGGDPAALDWSDFRPLRTSREEDWADWFQHLLRTSSSGTFARTLFAGVLPEGFDCAGPAVVRELSTDEGRRADVVIRWANGDAAHIEVKVGDTNFDKTFETCNAVEGQYPEIRTCSHFVLLPEGDRAAWLESARRMEPGYRFKVRDLTWGSVSFALRRALFDASEPVFWRVWALTFCGAIEQRLLGLPVVGRTTSARKDRFPGRATPMIAHAARMHEARQAVRRNA